MSSSTRPAKPPSCLIVVDLQHQFLNEHTRHIVPGIQARLEHYDWVFASRLLPKAGSPIHKWKGFLPLSIDEPGSALALDLGTRDFERTRIVEKPGFGALTSEVRTELLALGVETAHVVGVDTDLCVMRTVGDLMDIGIRPVVITDLVATTAGEPLHSHGLLILKRMIGRAQLTTSAELTV